MSRIDRKKRKVQLETRKKRKVKLAKLRQLYSAAESEVEKEKILGKARQLAPWLSREEFLAAIKAKEEIYGGE